MDDDVLTFQARSEPRMFQPLIRRKSRWITIPIGAAALAVAWGFEAAGDRFMAVAMVAGALLVALALPWHVASETVKRNAAKLSRTVSYRIDRTGIRSVNGFDESLLPWSRIRRIEVRADHIIVHVDRREFLMMPTSGLSQEQRSRLLKLLRSRDETAPSQPG